MPARPAAVLAMAPYLVEGMVREAHLERLRTLCEVPDPQPLARFDEPRAGALLRRAEILLSGWGCPPIDAGVLERAPALRAVFHAAGTVRPIASDALWDRRIEVSSAAAANALPVAEYTLAMILLANKRVFDARRLYRELRGFRVWSRELAGLGNYRKRVGIVGASRIGRRVIELLRPFDLDVCVADPHLDAAGARGLGVELVELDALLERCDVVSLHAPALESTRGLLDRRRLSRLRDGAVLINTARGALVDADALDAELVSGRIHAILDVTEPEILPSDSLLYDLPNVFLTPHIAGAQGAERERLVELALDEIERFVEGRELVHGVVKEDLERIA